MKAINIFCLLLLCIKVQGQGYVINGHIAGLKDAHIILYLEDSRDTAKLKDGHFTFKGRVPHPQQAYIGTGGQFSFALYIENTTMTVQGKASDLDGIKVTGGKTQQEYNVFLQQVKSITDKMNPLYELLQKDMSKKDSVLKIADALMETEYNPITAKFIQQHPSSFVSLYKLRELMGSKPLAEMEETYSRLSPQLRVSVLGKMIQEEFTIMHKTAVGQPAIDFTMNNRQGKPITLSSYKGSYVLLDFWASWCKPCREENPALKKAYERFKGQNFHILGVSLDKDSSAWAKAISTDQLPWEHVSDLSIWNNKVAKLYNIKSIPANFLINPEGIIIAKDLRGQELETRLIEAIRK